MGYSCGNDIVIVSYRRCCNARTATEDALFTEDVHADEGLGAWGSDPSNRGRLRTSITYLYAFRESGLGSPRECGWAIVSYLNSIASGSTG